VRRAADESRGWPEARAWASAALSLSTARRTSSTRARNGSGRGHTDGWHRDLPDPNSGHGSFLPSAWFLGLSGPTARRWQAEALCVGTVRWAGRTRSSLDIQANRLVRLTLLGMAA